MKRLFLVLIFLFSVAANAQTFSLLPPGTVIQWDGTATDSITLQEPEPGWLLQNGAIASITTYPRLYKRLGNNVYNNGGAVAGYGIAVGSNDGRSDRQWSVATPITDGTSGTPRTGKITEMANVGTWWLIKY